MVADGVVGQVRNVQQTIKLPDPRKDPKNCGRLNGVIGSHVCDPFHILTYEANEKLSMIARYTRPFKLTSAFFVVFF
jgi:hypothetical protein